MARATAASAAERTAYSRGLAAFEMAVGGIRCDTRPACGFAQHHGLGAARARQLDRGFQQRTPQVPVAVGAAGWRGLGRARHGLLRIYVDSVHYLCYSFVDGVHNTADWATAQAPES